MAATSEFRQLPVPEFFDARSVGEVRRVPYQERAAQARQWAEQHGIRPAAEDDFKIGLLGIDVQNTFCLPDFELYVGGRSGTGAVDDCGRLAQFIYRNLAHLTEITMTMDTHHAMQIFHSIFLVDEQGNHPAPATLVSAEDVAQGRWKFNPAVAPNLGISAEQGQELLQHYTNQLKNLGKYELTIWPYHSMLGGIGHALVAAVEEAVFFHTVARTSQARLLVKGDNSLTESYSAIGPEVTEGPRGRTLGEKNESFLEDLLRFDMLIVAGEAKSHCVAWTVSDLLDEIREQDPNLARKVYLLEDCTSPVVIPGVVDYTEQADAAFQRFADAGMNLVRSTEPIESWPGVRK